MQEIQCNGSLKSILHSKLLHKLQNFMSYTVYCSYGLLRTIKIHIHNLHCYIQSTLIWLMLCFAWRRMYTYATSHNFFHPTTTFNYKHFHCAMFWLALNWAGQLKLNFNVHPWCTFKSLPACPLMHMSHWTLINICYKFLGSSTQIPLA